MEPRRRDSSENFILFHFGGNSFDLGGLEIWKFGYWEKIPDLQI